MVAAADLLQELIRDRDQGGASLDRELLQRERLDRLWEAVLVGRSPEALEIVDVVNHRHTPGEELKCDRGQGVGEVVAVDEVGTKLITDLPKALERLRA